MTPKRLQEIRKKFKLSIPQLAQLCHAPIQPARKPNPDNWKGARSAKSSTVSDWLNGKNEIPAEIGELLETKVWVMENSNTSVATLLEHDLPYALTLYRSKLKLK